MNKPHRLNGFIKCALGMAVLVSSFQGAAARADKEDTQAEEKKDRETGDVEIKEQFPYSFDDVCDKLVLIECKGRHGDWSGSGFVAVMDGKTYIFINQHIILGADSIRFTTAAGEALRPRAVELAATRGYCPPAR